MGIPIIPMVRRVGRCVVVGLRVNRLDDVSDVIRPSDEGFLANEEEVQDLRRYIRGLKRALTWIEGELEKVKVGEEEESEVEAG